MLGKKAITNTIRATHMAPFQVIQNKFDSTHLIDPKQPKFFSQAAMATQFKMPENFNSQYYTKILDTNNPLSLDKLQVGYINGEWVTTKDKFPVFDPATEDPIAYMPNMDVSHVKYAIEAAYEAFPSYSALTMKQRHDILMKWTQLIKENANDLAKIMTLENGKSAFESDTELQFTANLFEWYAEQCRGLDGSYIPSVPGKRFLVYKQPIGVCSIILPWNVPMAMFARKLGAALAVGCTCVVKAASETPMSAVALTKLGEMAGLPKGVLNIITTAHKNVQEVGEEMSKNEMVKKISFTGSGPVGKALMNQASSTVKKMSLELGGNAPFIAFEDCDIEAAVDGLIASKFRNSGQTCVCANRAFVHSSIFDKFLEKLLDKVSKFEVGPGYTPGISIGPLVNGKAVIKCKNLVEQAKSVGAKAVYEGGENYQKMNFQKGFFFPPTVLDCRGVDHNKVTLFKEEIFGPVLALYPFESDEEVIEKANSVVEGLASYIYTKSFHRSVLVPEKLHYGMVGLNAGLLSHPEIPFGGVKQSGIGREGARIGMEDFMNNKFVCMGTL